MGSQPQLEPVLGVVKHPSGRVILAGGTHHVPFGPKNVSYHIGGEQGYGEEPGQQSGEVPAGADARVAGDRDSPRCRTTKMR